MVEQKSCIDSKTNCFFKDSLISLLERLETSVKAGLGA